MNIPFAIGTEEIRLTSDDKNFEIRKLKNRTDKTTGNSVEEWTPILFFSSLESALSRIFSLYSLNRNYFFQHFLLGESRGNTGRDPERFHKCAMAYP